MVILHIANVSEHRFYGVNIAVPLHVKAQQKHETVGFINTAGLKLEGIENQLEYRKNMSFKELPEPFCKPDIIVFHEVYQRNMLPLLLEAERKKLPYVIIPHGCLTQNAQNHKKIKKLFGNFLLYNRIIGRAIGIQCLSEAELENTHFRVHKFIGTNGIEILNRKESFGENGISFVYIGRLDIYIKGLDILSEAVKLCADFLRENRCRISLYGPDENGCHARLKAMTAENGTDDIVSVFGPVTGEEKQNILLSSDCFIQLSRSEGMSMGILEALGTGLPCIVSEGTGMADIVSKAKAGWKCGNDAESAADAIRLAVKSKDNFNNYSHSAILLTEKNYSWDKVSLDAIGEYKKLLKTD